MGQKRRLVGFTLALSFYAVESTDSLGYWLPMTLGYWLPMTKPKEVLDTNDQLKKKVQQVHFCVTCGHH